MLIPRSAGCAATVDDHAPVHSPPRPRALTADDHETYSLERLEELCSHECTDIADVRLRAARCYVEQLAMLDEAARQARRGLRCRSLSSMDSGEATDMTTEG